MKLVSWNVNSVRSRRERLLAFLERHSPDVVCLQETKVLDEDFPLADVAAAGYQAALHGQRGYNGVALLSRLPLESIERGFDGNPAPEEARVIAATVDGVRVIDVYVVNGQSLGSDKYRLKLDWLDALLRWLDRFHEPQQPLAICGDFNIAPTDEDVHAPALWRDRVLVSTPERQRLRALLGWGVRDLQRSLRPAGTCFTWWDYRNRAFARDLGLRIDLVLATPSLARRCVAFEVDRGERAPDGGPGKPSDHAPVIASFGERG